MVIFLIFNAYIFILILDNYDLLFGYLNISILTYIICFFLSFVDLYKKKEKRLEHKKLNAIMYVRYNTRLKEQSIQRKQNVDPILVEEIDFDDEWIIEKEAPLLLFDASWLEDEELFNVDVTRIASSKGKEIQAPSVNIVSSHSYKRKQDEFASKDYKIKVIKLIELNHKLVIFYT